MQHLKRLLWLFVAGFATVAGASLALGIAILAFQHYAEGRRQADNKPDPMDYQPPLPGQVVFSDLVLLEITRNGGVRGIVSNGTARKVRSFNANLAFFRKDELLYTCNETVLVSVEPGAKGQFQMLCKDVERSALTPDITPKLSVVRVYPSRDE